MRDSVKNEQARLDNRQSRCRTSNSVHTLERRDRLALVFVKRLVNHIPVLDLNLRLGVVTLEGECVLHPVRIVTLRVILSGVCSTRLLSCMSSSDSLNSTLQKVAKFKGFNQVTDIRKTT